MNSLLTVLSNIVRLLKRPAQLLWASPVTLACLLVYALPCWALKWYRSLGIVGDALVLVTSDKMPNWLAKLWAPWAGQCCGNVIVLRHAPGTSDHANRTLAHELEHTHQAMVWGPVFPLAYAVASLIALIKGQDRYRMNAFEVDARRAAGQRVD